MSSAKSHDDLLTQLSSATKSLNDYLTELTDQGHNKKADLISYWIKDYVRFLRSEEEYDPKKNRKYKRGDVIKVHLGFRIGSEEGGLHYCVVLDKIPALSSPVLTVVPLTSVKKKDDLEHLPRGCVYIGNEIYNLINLKISGLKQQLSASRDLDKYKQLERIIAQHEKEVSKLKMGSIVLTNQITTISKIRIYDPKHDNDLLSGIKLSNTNLDKIDKAVLDNYTNIQN